MTKDEALVKIKEQLKKLMSFSAEGETPAEDEKKFSTLKLKDGSEISIPEGTELGVGVEVYGTDADGNQVPLEDGEYILDDGRTITVVGNKVDSISETESENPEEAKTETPETDAKEMAAEDKPTDGSEQPEGGNPIEDRINALENQVNQILEILQGMGSMQEVAMSKLEELASQPAVESIKLEKTIKTPYENKNVQFGSLKSEMDELKSLRKKFNFNNNYNFSATPNTK